MIQMEMFPSENGTKFLSDIPVDGSDGNATLWKYSYNILTIKDKMSIMENKKVRHNIILRMQAFTLLHATKHSLVFCCSPSLPGRVKPSVCPTYPFGRSAATEVKPPLRLWRNFAPVSLQRKFLQRTAKRGFGDARPSGGPSACGAVPAARNIACGAGGEAKHNEAGDQPSGLETQWIDYSQSDSTDDLMHPVYCTRDNHYQTKQKNDMSNKA
jgi:hypothetical protein